MNGVESLTVHKARVAAEAASRYDALRAKGRDDLESRNIAVAWTAQKFRLWARSNIRRVLDETLTARSRRTGDPSPASGGHWRLP